ncbi:MAG TPA: hypothetical protein VD903_06890 [Pseudonocardia sp.]|nr:hypothetical protein [Pseudonocardia sp.]
MALDVRRREPASRTPPLRVHPKIANRCRDGTCGSGEIEEPSHVVSVDERPVAPHRPMAQALDGDAVPQVEARCAQVAGRDLPLVPFEHRERGLRVQPSLQGEQGVGLRRGGEADHPTSVGSRPAAGVAARSARRRATTATTSATTDRTGAGNPTTSRLVT